MAAANYRISWGRIHDHTIGRPRYRPRSSHDFCHKISMLQLPLQTLTWAPVRSAPALAGADLHLWKIPTGCGGAPVGDLWALLSKAERERAGRLRLTAHRERYLRAQGGLRRILASYLDLSPDVIVFQRSGHGKPYLAGAPPPFHFNLTTSHGLALVGVSLRLPLGVDCEHLRTCSEMSGIARRMFAQEVADQVMAAAEPERRERFYRAWTALEAAVKADGLGLFRRNGIAPAPEFRIDHCVPHAGYIAAVARVDLPPVSRWHTLVMEDR